MTHEKLECRGQRARQRSSAKRVTSGDGSWNIEIAASAFGLLAMTGGIYLPHPLLTKEGSCFLNLISESVLSI